MNIYFALNHKGGVGKSFFLRALIEYHLDRQLDFVAFDCDRNNPDIYRCYKNVTPVRLAIFSEASKFEDAANSIFNAGIERTVMVNLPAQCHEPFKKWIFDNELLEIGKEVGVRLHFFFVTDSGYDSLQILRRTLELYQHKVTYTVVKNYGRATDFDSLDSDRSLQHLLERYEAQTITLPCFIGSTLRNAIDGQSLSFGEALTSSDFGIIDKQRIRKFLRESYSEIDRVLQSPFKASQGGYEHE